MRISETNKAYLAGMIDGDGSISMTRITGERERAVVSIANSYRPLLEWVVSKCGGSIVPRAHVCPEECDKIHVHTRKVGYRWMVRGERAVVVLKGIEPYLIEKRDKAALIIGRGTPPVLNPAAVRVQQEMRELGW